MASEGKDPTHPVVYLMLVFAAVGALLSAAIVISVSNQVYTIQKHLGIVEEPAPTITIDGREYRLVEKEGE